jgi:tRNA pseudouridine55 synthase
LTIDGILNIDKPLGPTSFQVVAKVKRLTGLRRVGHGGALDPLATGVLPVCLGQGTRVAEFLMLASKTYRAQIELGITTDTYDAAGKVLQRINPSEVSHQRLEQVLAQFRGWLEQTPPMYSALRHQGQRLYKLARAGLEVARRPRRVHLSRLELVDCQLPLFTIEVDCSKGTYIRSLAHDLGQALGCGAYLKNLVRLRCGTFDLRDATSLASFEKLVCQGEWLPLVHPMDTVLSPLKAVVVGQAEQQDIEQGRLLALETNADEEICRAYSQDGRFLALLRVQKESGLWHPYKVFARPAERVNLTKQAKFDNKPLDF